MEAALNFEFTAENAAEFEEIIKDLLAEMKTALEEMKNDQAEIDRLKAETRAILAELEAE
jgi:hypothetical protein